MGLLVTVTSSIIVFDHSFLIITTNIIIRYVQEEESPEFFLTLKELVSLNDLKILTL